MCHVAQTVIPEEYATMQSETHSQRYIKTIKLIMAIIFLLELHPLSRTKYVHPGTKPMSEGTIHPLHRDLTPTTHARQNERQKQHGKKTQTHGTSWKTIKGSIATIYEGLTLK